VVIQEMKRRRITRHLYVKYTFVKVKVEKNKIKK